MRKALDDVSEACGFQSCNLPRQKVKWCSTHYEQQRRGEPLRPIGQKQVSNREVFLSQVEESASGCWLWTGSTNWAGYSKFQREGQISGHRYAYQEFVGPIPEDAEIDHKCSVRNCVNPQHLHAVTRAENAQRMKERPNRDRNVYWEPGRRKWKVGLEHCGKHIFGGRFESKEDAIQAASDLRRRVFTNSGD